MQQGGAVLVLALVISGWAMLACRSDSAEPNGDGASRDASADQSPQLPADDAGDPDSGLVMITAKSCTDAGMGEVTRRGKCTDGQYHIQ